MVESIAERLKRAELTYARVTHQQGKEDSWELAYAAAALGLAHCAAGSVRQAVIYLEKVALSEFWPTYACVHANYPTLVEVLEALAYIHSMLEDPAKELAIIDRELRLHEQWSNKEGMAWALARLADHCLQQGDTKGQAAVLNNAEALASNLTEGLRKLVEVRLSHEAAGRLFNLLLVSDAADHVGGRRTMDEELDLVYALEGLGPDFTSLSDLKKVERLAQLLEQKHGPDTLAVARVLVVLAEMRAEQGALDFKEETLRCVLRLQEQHFGLDSVYITWTLRGLAHVCGQRGKLQQRLELLRRTLDIQEEELGANHKHTTTTRFFLREVQEEFKRAQGGEGRELSGLFGRRTPMNPKVNRYAGEVVLPTETPISATVKPFPLECSGGGACAWRATGLDMPFYALRSGSAA